MRRCHGGAPMTIAASAGERGERQPERVGLKRVSRLDQARWRADMSATARSTRSIQVRTPAASARGRTRR